MEHNFTELVPITMWAVLYGGTPRWKISSHLFPPPVTTWFDEVRLRVSAWNCSTSGIKHVIRSTLQPVMGIGNRSGSQYYSLPRPKAVEWSWETTE